jgi:thiol-disulfide isomerase/thioredoxin
MAMFMSATCPPCRMIEPVFEELAREKAKRGGEGQVVFAKVDLGVGMGSMVMREYGIAATPTFVFFLDEKKVSI